MNAAQKTIITIALLVIFNIVIFAFVISPAVSDIKAFNDRIQMERAALENKYESRRNMQNIADDLKYVSDNIAAIERMAIIPKDGKVDFISELEKIAANNNLEQKIKIAPASVNGKKNPLAEKEIITISLSGDYIDILKYMNDLERSDVYVTISSINITSGGNQAAEKIKINEEVKAYLNGYVYFSI